MATRKCPRLTVTLLSINLQLSWQAVGIMLNKPSIQYKALHVSVDDTKPAEDINNTIYIYTRAGFNKPPVAVCCSPVYYTLRRTTPAGQYKTLNPSIGESKRAVNVPVYIYTWAGLNKPPVAVRCSPVCYILRQTTPATKHITIDTSNMNDEIPFLPEPVMLSKSPTSYSSIDPPLTTSAPSPSPVISIPPPANSHASTPARPASASTLPYRMIYAIATQDAIHVYNTQQQRPRCIVIL